LLNSFVPAHHQPSPVTLSEAKGLSPYKDGFTDPRYHAKPVTLSKVKGLSPWAERSSSLPLYFRSCPSSALPCHPERSEGSLALSRELLHAVSVSGIILGTAGSADFVGIVDLAGTVDLA
jgi:hypothetical protein